MTKVKVKFPCGYEKERSDFHYGTEHLRSLIKKSHKEECTKCKKQ